MNDLLIVIERIKNQIFSLLSQIQTTKNIDDKVFDSLCFELESSLTLMSGHSNIPRELLKEIYLTQEIIRNEAPYFGEEQEKMIAMAVKIERYFRLILIDKLP